MIVKRLLKAWRSHPAGTTVVIPNDVHEELVDESVVEPTSEVRRLIAEWRDPSGETHPAGVRVELDGETKANLLRIGVLEPTAHDAAQG